LVLTFCPTHGRSDIILPFDTFVGTRRGRTVGGVLDLANISSVSLMLVKSKNPNFVQSGKFSLWLFGIKGLLKNVQDDVNNKMSEAEDIKGAL